MTDMTLRELPLPGLRLLTHRTHQDARGRFSRLYCLTWLSQTETPFTVRQINLSQTMHRGSVRGLHYQLPPFAEDKLITCLRGSVWDVAVDVRHNSPTFLKWHAERLEAGDGRSLWLPPGFAHGFQALSDDAQLLYLHSADYVPNQEAGLAPGDPQLTIDWPLPIANLSSRDAAHPRLTDAFRGIVA